MRAQMGTHVDRVPIVLGGVKITAAFLVYRKTNREGSEGRGGLFSICCLYGLKYFILKKGQTAAGGWRVVEGGSYVN